MFQQAADIRVMVANAGRRGAEIAHQRVVHQKTLGQSAQVRVRQLQQGCAQSLEKLANVLLRVWQEIGQIDLFRVGALEVAEDHLERALEELDLSLDQKEIAGVEGAEQVFAGVPETCA